MKNILIVGANGFIGRNIIEDLENYTNNYKLIYSSSKDLDASNERDVKKALFNENIDVVLHSGVYNPRIGKNKDANKEIEKNLRMFFNFERYQEYYGKMIYLGSGAEFDKRNNISLVKEDSFINNIPIDDYGFYKYIINKSIKESRNIINLRVFGLFGKYENWKRTFISGACCKAIKGLPITIKQNVLFDYLYISDFIKILKFFIDNEVIHKDYNIVSNEKTDLISIANYIKKISNKDIPIYVCYDDFGNEYTADNNRLINEIGEFKFRSLEDSISNLYNWYQINEELIDIYSLLYQ